MDARGHQGGGGGGVGSRVGSLPALILMLTAMAVRRPPPRSRSTTAMARPIIAGTCLKCHGPDKANRKAKFRLDDRDSALAKVFVPGKPAEVNWSSASPPPTRMTSPPPPRRCINSSAGRSASRTRWIAEGAAYQPRWSYIAPIKAPLPAVADPAWSRRSHRCLHRRPAWRSRRWRHQRRRTGRRCRAASRPRSHRPAPTPRGRRLRRRRRPGRLSHPGPARLLASPHYGERMAVPWLSMNFADTVASC